MKEEVLLTGWDLKRFFLRFRSRVLKWSVGIALFVTFCFLVSPLKYRQEATLRMPAASGLLGAKAEGLLSRVDTGAGSGSMLAIFQSRRMIEQVVKELGLQIVCSADSWGRERFHMAQGRMLFELDKKEPLSAHFEFRDVTFEEEGPVSLFLCLRGTDEYELWDTANQLVGKAKIGAPLRNRFGCLTLSLAPSTAKVDQFYPVHLVPLEKVVKAWKKKLKVALSKANRDVLQLEFIDKDRFVGARFLDALVRSCEQFVKQEGAEVIAEQVRLLQEREELVAASHRAAIFDYASHLERNINEFGFDSYTHEIEAFSAEKKLCASKLFDLDLQLRRLQQISSMPSQAGQICSLKFPQEFSGLPTSVVLGTLDDYTQQNSSLQLQLNELLFLKKQIEGPHFEIASLGSFSEDPLIKELVNKAGTLALQLMDTGNRSVREQERLVEELATQKGFLLHYLSQVVDLKRLKSDVVRGKISLLKSEAQRLLKSEQVLLESKQRELQVSLKNLPQKWTQEVLFRFKQDQAAAMLEGIEQAMVTIQLRKSNVDLCLRPLDLVRVPLEPWSSKLEAVFFTTWIITGLCLYLALFLVTLYRGFPVSSALLKQWGLRVCGALSQRAILLHSLEKFLSILSLPSQLIVFMGGEPFPDVAKRMARKGKKVLLLNGPHDLETARGYDHQMLPLDGVDISAQLSLYRSQYDCILLYAPLSLALTEGLDLLAFADQLVLTVHEERKEDLLPYIEWSESKGVHSLAFILNQIH